MLLRGRGYNGDKLPFISATFDYYPTDIVLRSSCRTSLYISIFPYFFDTRYVQQQVMLPFFVLIVFILGLLQNLDDCGSPPLNSRCSALSRATSLRTSDRKSLLAYVGLPLDIFGKVCTLELPFSTVFYSSLSFRMHSSNLIFLYNKLIC